MRLSWLLALPAAVLSVTSALAIERRDADFFSVRTTMHKDMSGKRGDPKGKYFRESASTVACLTGFRTTTRRTYADELSSTDESVYVPNNPSMFD